MLAQKKVARIADEVIPVVRATSVTPDAKTGVAPRRINENVLPAVAQSFSNTRPITINDGAVATPFPSAIAVAGVAGTVQRVSVTLNGFSHTFPSDVDFLLVSPSGRKSVIMSDAGSSIAVSNLNITLDDYAQRPLPFAVTGNTGVPVTTLRFHVVDITTLGNTTVAQADLRLLGSTARSVTNTASATVNLVALALQTPPTQAAGGGINSSLGVTAITTTVPLAAGAPIDLEFTLGVMRDGPFRFLINVEALPSPPPPPGFATTSGEQLKAGGTKQADKLRQ